MALYSSPSLIHDLNSHRCRYEDEEEKAIIEYIKYFLLPKYDK